MDTQIVLFSTGAWMWISDVREEWLEDKHVLITLGEGFSDRQVDEMINSYYMENIDYLFKECV